MRAFSCRRTGAGLLRSGQRGAFRALCPSALFLACSAIDTGFSTATFWAGYGYRVRCTYGMCKFTFSERVFGRYVPSARPSRGSEAPERCRGSPRIGAHPTARKTLPTQPIMPSNGARSPATSVPWRYGNARLPTTASDARRPSPRRISSCCLLMRGAAVRRRRLPHVLGQLQDARSATSALDRRYSEPRLADGPRLEAYLVDVFVDAERGGWKARRVREPLLSDRHQRAYDTCV